MSNDIVIKQIPAQWIASVRETIPNYPSVGKLCGEVAQSLPAGTGGIGVALWHDPEFRDHDVDAEGGVYLKQQVAASGRVQVHELPPATVASTLHYGAFNRLNQVYDALLRWVGSNGYRVSGPIRELYLQLSMPVRQDDESYITEIQVPVVKSF